MSEARIQLEAAQRNRDDAMGDVLIELANAVINNKANGELSGALTNYKKKRANLQSAENEFLVRISNFK